MRGAELIKILSADARERLDRGGQRGFVDATAEPGPDPGDEPASADPFPSETDLSQGPLASIPEEPAVAGDVEAVRLERDTTMAVAPSTPQRTAALFIDRVPSSSRSSSSSSCTK